MTPQGGKRRPRTTRHQAFARRCPDSSTPRSRTEVGKTRIATDLQPHWSKHLRTRRRRHQRAGATILTTSRSWRARPRRRPDPAPQAMAEKRRPFSSPRKRSRRRVPPHPDTPSRSLWRRRAGRALETTARRALQRPRTSENTGMCRPRSLGPSIPTKISRCRGHCARETKAPQPPSTERVSPNNFLRWRRRGGCGLREGGGAAG
jgi:hypothetical protein